MPIDKTEKLPHPDTVPRPSAMYLRLKGRSIEDARATLLTEVDVGRMLYADAYKMIVALFPDSPEAKENAERAAAT